MGGIRFALKTASLQGLFVATTLAACPWANAEVFYSSFGAGDAYDHFSGTEIEGPTSALPQALAEQFTSPTSFNLESVDLALSFSVGSPRLRLELYEDIAGAPGALLETSLVNNFASGIVSADFGGGTVLTGGENYWIGAFAEDSSQFTWNDSPSTDFAFQSVSEDDGATWFSYSTDPFPGAAYRINGTVAGPTEVSFIAPGEAWRYLPGLAEPSVGTSWASTSFDDATWQFDFGGFGFDDDTTTNAGLMMAVATPLPGMRDNGVNADAHTSLYLRREFDVDVPSELSELVLQLDYDDSFIAYVNGVEVARSQFGTIGVPEPFDAVGNEHESTNGDTGQFLERLVIDLVGEFPGLLFAGASNVLAIQGLNSALDDDDFVLSQISLGGNRFSVLLPGDYNNDGLVDGADYTVWRNNLDGPAGSLENDIDGGPIGQAQYETWKSLFGQSAAAQSSLNASAVPEPATAFAMFAGSTLLISARFLSYTVKAGITWHSYSNR